MSTSPAPRLVTFGETMALVRTTEIGTFRHASALALGVGGAESNVAIGVSRLDVAASWLGRVGDDSLGQRVLREIRGEGVDVHGVIDTEASTGLMLKERPSAESTAVHYYRAGSAGSRLAPSDLPDGWIEQAALLHVTGITPLLSENAAATVDAAVRRAKAAGAGVSFDVNYRSALAAPEVAGPALRTVAEQADVVFGGPEELTLLHPGVDPAEAAGRLLESGCEQVVLKRGADGATVFTIDDVIEATGFLIDVVDTVGAGDAFVAGYLSARLEELPVAAALQRANACGAMACLGPGDWEASPTRRDLELFQQSGADPVRR